MLQSASSSTTTAHPNSAPESSRRRRPDPASTPWRRGPWHAFRACLATTLVISLVIPGAASVAQAAPKKKKAAAEQAGDTEKPAAEGASQNADQERPKPILEEDSGAPAPDAPKPDAQGNLNFGGKSATGKITVKAPAEDKVKIYLEGRYFGAAPRTIHKVPSGDYIIELVLPGGKRVARPVSVSTGEEALVEVSGAETAAATEKKEAPITEEQLQKRWKWTKIAGISGISLVVLGAAMGYYGQYVVQGQYDDKLTAGPGSGQSQSQWQEELDQLSSRGDLMVNAANVCYVAGGIGVIIAGVLGYTVYRARKSGAGGVRKTEGLENTPPPMTFMLSPGRTGGGMAGVSFTF